MPWCMIWLMASVVAIVRRKLCRRQKPQQVRLRVRCQTNIATHHAAWPSGHRERDIVDGAVVDVACFIHNGRPQHCHVVPIE